MKLHRLFASVLALVVVAIQFVRPLTSNPSLPPELSLSARAYVPAPVALALDRACADCHSNQTRWPWYSRVAPASWLVAEHVNHGRRHLNFSDWEGLTTADASRTLSEICREARTRRMPLPSYLLVHRGARLTDGEVRAICEWTTREADQLSLAARRLP